jgi:hypothetical protein
MIKLKHFIYLISLLLVSLLYSCGESQGDNAGGNSLPPIISDNAFLLDPDSEKSLESVDRETKVITFSSKTKTLSDIKAGDVLVIPSSPNFPDGMLIKVISVTEAGGKVEVVYEDATLTDIIVQGTLELSQLELTADDIDSIEVEDQNSEFRDISSSPQPLISLLPSQGSDLRFRLGGTINYSRNYSIYIKAFLSLSVGYKFRLVIQGASLKELQAIAKASEKAGIIVYAKAGASAKYKKRLGRVKFKPKVVKVGWVPVYVRPVLYFYAGAKGKAQSEARTSIDQSLSFEAGITYNGKWNPIQKLERSFTFEAPSLKKSDVSLTGYIEPQLVFWIYGVAGPYVRVNGNLSLTASPLIDPWCKLLAGVDGYAGAKIAIFSKKLADVNLSLFNLDFPLYECQDPYLIVTPEGTLMSYGPEKGPFSPSSITFTLTSSNEKDVEYEVSTASDWLDISNPKGSASKNNPQSVEVSVNSKANSFKEGKYQAVLEFKNVTSPGKGDHTRTVYLEVRKPSFDVRPVDALLIGREYEGGDFSGIGNVDFTLLADIDGLKWQVQGYPQWLKLSSESGQLTRGQPVTVTASINQDQAKSLKAGTHKASLLFQLYNNSGDLLKEEQRTVYIQVLMNVRPQSEQILQVPEGGPAPSETLTYTIEAINGPINWEAYVESNNPLVNNKKLFKGVTQQGQSSTINVALDSGIEDLPKGKHSEAVFVRNLESGVYEDNVELPITIEVVHPFSVSP